VISTKLFCFFVQRVHQSSLRVFRAEDGGQETSNRQKGFSDVERDSFHGKGRRKRSADHHESLAETFRPRFWTGKISSSKTMLKNTIKHVSVKQVWIKQPPIIQVSIQFFFFFLESSKPLFKKIY
jgi:hypothetical protein